MAVRRARNPGELDQQGDICPHRPPCPGCPRFGEPGPPPAALGALERLAQEQRLPGVSVIRGARREFRLRARLAIRGRLGSPKLGLFELGTHRVVHIPTCRVQHPLINLVAAVVRRALVDARITCYSERAQLGLARYLQVAVERSSQTAQVVMVANSPTPGPLAPFLDLIAERLGEKLHSLWFNANCGPANTILGRDFTRWCGPATLVERFGGARIHYPPGAFGQSNLDIAQRIIEHLRGEIPRGARVAEFYAGVGAIGLSILSSASELHLNEASPDALAGLECGLAELEPAQRARVSVFPGPAGAACHAAQGADVVIADPPRKGLDPELVSYLCKQPPQRFLYVSCGLASFLSDAARLLSCGALRLRALAAFDLMPFTEHVESVARFERTGSN